MRRREFIAALGGAAAWPVVARGQLPAVPVIGFLQRSAPIRNDFENFRDGLKALGYVDGRTIRIEQRYADLNVDRLRELAQELVGMKVKVLVVDGSATIRTALTITKTTPIVAALIGGPTQYGIANLGRPGGNLTGLSNFADDLDAKRLELLKQLIPGARRVIVLVDRDNPNPVAMRLVEHVAKAVGVDLRPLEVGQPGSWPASFASIAAFQPDALLQFPSANFASAPKELVDVIGVHRLPAVYAEREFIDAGGLMYYGIDLSEQWRRLAGYVDKILNGAKPGELPIEQPTKFNLAINLKAAKAINLTVPTAILLRADEVIE
jgi:putative tryptophan/tyrosine transport system substrate-binding protein